MISTKISIDEKQLEALNELVSSGVSISGERDSLAVVIANEWLVEVRQALVAAQEVD